MLNVRTTHSTLVLIAVLGLMLGVAVLFVAQPEVAIQLVVRGGLLAAGIAAVLWAERRSATHA
jgi:hypothetical protein